MRIPKSQVSLFTLIEPCILIGEPTFGLKFFGAKLATCLAGQVKLLSITGAYGGFNTRGGHLRSMEITSFG